MTTTTTFAGRGDDFTATAECSCGWSQRFTLDDADLAMEFVGCMMHTAERAEQAAAEHTH